MRELISSFQTCMINEANYSSTYMLHVHYRVIPEIEEGVVKFEKFPRGINTG